MRWEASGLGALVGSVDCARGTALSAGHRASQVRRMVPLLCAAAAGCLLCFVAASARGADRAKAAPAPLDNEDLLAEVVAQNAGVYLDPPAPAARKASKVSPVSPVPAAVAKKAPRTSTSTAKTKNHHRDIVVERKSPSQLRIKLPGSQPVLAPAMADGKIFVGGGFNSTRYYCLDAANGQTLWNVNLSDNGPSASSYDHGKLLFTTESCTCYALDAASGRTLWSVWLGNSVISTPTIAGDTVLVSYPVAARPRFAPVAARPRSASPRAPNRTTCGYVLAARDLQTGKPLWQKWIDHDVMSAPVVCIDEVYVVTFAGTLYKFALEDGEILMARRCHATSAPVVLDDGIYLTRRGDHGQGMPRECLVKLDRNTGKQLYLTERCLAPYLADAQTRAQYAQAGVSAAGDDSLADDPPERKPLPGDPDYVSGAPPDTRSPSMRLVGRDGPQALQAFCGSRLASFNGGLFNWMGGQLRAVDPATGARRWSVILEGLETGNEAAAGDHAAAPPAVANGKLFVATRSGQLLRIDPTNGRITGRVNLDAPAASQPVIDQGRVLVGTTKGELVCINTGDPAWTGWNQWGGDAAHSGSAEAAVASGAADKLPRETGHSAHHPR